MEMGKIYRLTKDFEVNGKIIPKGFVFTVSLVDDDKVHALGGVIKGEIPCVECND